MTNPPSDPTDEELAALVLLTKASPDGGVHITREEAGRLIHALQAARKERDGAYAFFEGDAALLIQRAEAAERVLAVVEKARDIARDDADEAERAVAVLRDALTQLEWETKQHGGICPACDGRQESGTDVTYGGAHLGHRRDCFLANALTATATAATAYEERIRAEENEACAKIAEDADTRDPFLGKYKIAEAIRARRARREGE